MSKGYWFSLENGTHIHVGEGETPKEATERVIGKQKESKSGKKLAEEMRKSEEETARLGMRADDEEKERKAQKDAGVDKIDYKNMSLAEMDKAGFSGNHNEIIAGLNASKYESMEDVMADLDKMDVTPEGREYVKEYASKVFGQEFEDKPESDFSRYIKRGLITENELAQLKDNFKGEDLKTAVERLSQGEGVGDVISGVVKYEDYGEKKFTNFGKKESPEKSYEEALKEHNSIIAKINNQYEKGTISKEEYWKKTDDEVNRFNDVQSQYTEEEIKGESQPKSNEDRIKQADRLYRAGKLGRAEYDEIRKAYEPKETKPFIDDDVPNQSKKERMQEGGLKGHFDRANIKSEIVDNKTLKVLDKYTIKDNGQLGFDVYEGDKLVAEDIGNQKDFVYLIKELEKTNKPIKSGSELAKKMMGK